MPYRCRPCNQYFSVKSHTFMRSSNLSYRMWAMAIVLVKHDYTSIVIGKALGTSPSTAWHIKDRIRRQHQRTAQDRPA